MNISVPKHSALLSSSFLYGVATSSFQIEGAASERAPCIWDTFCGQPGAVKDQSNGDTACDHYHLWEKDIEMIESLDVDAYRLSICWPRIILADNTVNQKGVDFYIRLLDKLAEKNIKAFVTLYHWDLPQYLEDQGGWLNRNTAYRFRDYVDTVTQLFGDRVTSYATLNEPFCSAYLGYEVGVHAPGLADKNYGRKAAHHLLLAHGLAMEVLKKNCPGIPSGIVLNFTPCYPVSESAEDLAATELANQYHNQWYAQPVLAGSYPDIIYQLPQAARPDIEEGDMEIISQPMDFLGVNFYTRAMYQADNEELFREIPPQGVPITDIGWEVYPQALTDLLTSLHQKYSLPPVYITENGAAIDDKVVDQQVQDEDRINYYNLHLNALHDAIEHGVNVQGYFAWSLMDNFEWAEGYLKRFGIVHVDFETQKRTLKNSALAYRDFINQRR